MKVMFPNTNDNRSKSYEAVMFPQGHVNVFSDTESAVLYHLSKLTRGITAK